MDTFLKSMLTKTIKLVCNLTFDQLTIGQMKRSLIKFVQGHHVDTITLSFFFCFAFSVMH